jgi:pimeloyl-ACP methyl ester carboxylesterase
MAIDFRGRGQSHGPGGMEASDEQLEIDVMAAVRYLHEHGAKSVSIVGGSMGGAAAGDASIVSKPGEIDRIVMLGAAPNLPADKLKSPALFIVARDDTSGNGPRLPGIRAQYEKAPEPKKLVVLEGSAHAQYLFDTEQGERGDGGDTAVAESEVGGHRRKSSRRGLDSGNLASGSGVVRESSAIRPSLPKWFQGDPDAGCNSRKFLHSRSRAQRQ